MNGRGAPLFPDVVVNGERVSPQDIAAEVQNHPVAGNKPGLAWRKAAGSLAVRALLLQEAGRRNISANPQRSGGSVETEEEALIRDLLEDAVAVEAPREREIRAEWARDPSRFRSSPLWEVSHILFRKDPAQPKDRPCISIRALEVAGKAHADPQGFPGLARQYSDCDSARSGGRLGQLRPGDSVPEFEAALRSLEEGEVTATPVCTRFGWHVIRMDAVESGRILPFAAVRNKISIALEKAAWTRAAKAFVDQLVTESDIEGIDLSSISMCDSRDATSTP